MKIILLFLICFPVWAQSTLTVTPLQVQCAEQPAVNSNDSILVYGQMAYNIDGTTKIDVARFKGWTRSSIKDSSAPVKICQKIKKAMNSHQNLKLRVSGSGEIQDLNHP